MHLSCPRCDTVVNVYDYNLFEIWTCKKCDWRFRGVHAGFPGIRNFINSIIAPLYTSNGLIHLANCTHCGSIVNLKLIGIHTDAPRNFGQYPGVGYNGPYVCKRCCRNLPWDYPEQFDHVAKAFNEEWDAEKGGGVDRKSSADESTEDPESSVPSDFAKMAQDLFKKKHNIV
jgi:hypothetical protein